MINPQIYDEYVKIVLELAKEHGIWQYFLKETDNVVASIKYVPPSRNATESQINMQQLLLIFVIYGVGNCAAMLVYLIEVSLEKF